MNVVELAKEQRKAIHDYLITKFGNSTLAEWDKADMITKQFAIVSAQRAIDLLTEPLSEEEIGYWIANHIHGDPHRPWFLAEDVRAFLCSLRVPKQVETFSKDALRYSIGATRGLDIDRATDVAWADFGGKVPIDDDIESTSLPLIPTPTRTVHIGPQWIPWHEGDKVPELPSKYHRFVIHCGSGTELIFDQFPNKDYRSIIRSYMIIIGYTPPKVEEMPKCQNGHEVVAEYAEESGQWYWICYGCRIRSYVEHDARDEALEAVRKLGGKK